MKDMLRIQSIGDLITNSSTEVFTIIDEDVIKDIKNVMKIFGGEELVDRFDFFLDYCEVIENYSSSIIEELEDSYNGDLPPYEDEEYFMKEIIKSIVDPRVIEYHYNLIDDTTKETKPFVYSTWSEDSKYMVPVEELKDKALVDFLRDHIYEYCDNLNESSSDYYYYPTVCVFPKDKSNTRDAEIAKTASHLPFLCSHTASYC